MRVTAAPPLACTTSVMRTPNCSSMTTTSPRAIGLPLTRRSTGWSARRSSVTTEPGPSDIAWPSDIFVRPTSTASSTTTAVRRSSSVRSISPVADADPPPSAACAPRGLSSMSWGIGGTSSLDGDVHEQDIGDLDVGGLENPRADLVLELVAALAAGQRLRGLAGDRVGDDVADDRLLRQRAVAVGGLGGGRGL